MRETKYSEAAVQVLDVLNYTNREDVKKIPQSFIKFLTEIADENYRANLNHNEPINGLNLNKQTKELLGFIYITWWCNDKERNNYKNIINSNNLRIEKIENYKYDVFKDKKETNITENTRAKEMTIIEENKENLLKKVLNKILNFFKNKNERGK